jgi:hypothetical protein
VRYCAVPAVEETHEESGGGRDEDESAEATSLCAEGSGAAFASQLEQQREPHVKSSDYDGETETLGSGEGMCLRLVDERQMLRCRVRMVAPRKGDRFL